MKDSRLVRWFTLGNWTRAGDFAVKITAVVAGIAALNFFVQKPELRRRIVCSITIDGAQVAEAYRAAKHKEPAVVARAAKQTWAAASSKACSLITFQGATILPPLKLPANSDDSDPVVRALYGSYNDAPEYVGQLASELSKNELRIALAAFDPAQRYNIALTIANDGNAVVRNVRVFPPPGYRPPPVPGPQDVSIEPGNSVAYMFQGSDPKGLEPSAYAVTHEPSEVVNTSLLFHIWLGVMGLWVLLVVRDVVEEKRPLDSSGRSNP